MCDTQRNLLDIHITAKCNFVTLKKHLKSNFRNLMATLICERAIREKKLIERREREGKRGNLIVTMKRER